MDPGELAQHDLNLLVALHALLTARHVTRAASAVGMSQPAMSRSLGRLREMFDDPILVRTKAGMTPTARALALYPEVEELLARVRGMIRPAHFDPSKAIGAVRMAAPDIVSYMLVPPLIQRLSREAPRLDLEIVAWSAHWREELERGGVDLTVGIPAGDELNLYTRPLVAHEWACVLRRGHPALGKKWTLELFAALDHVLVSLSGRGGGHVDEALAAHGLRRRIALRIPYPALAPHLVAETDLVVTTPRWLALKLASAGGVVVRRPPIAIPPVRAALVWHERSHRDPQQRWLRDVLARESAALDRRALAW